MAYTITYFQSQGSKNSLLVSSSVWIANDQQSVLLLNEVEDSYIPKVWSSVLKQKFLCQPEKFIRDNWYILSDLSQLISEFFNEATSFISGLNSEQKYIVENVHSKFPKSGVSFISLSFTGNKMKYNLLGDNFLFFYDKRKKILMVYCSMLDKAGHLDFNQSCHCLFNDLTILGKPLIGDKKLSDSYVFVMTRDLANWFVNNYSNNAMDILLSIKDDKEYELFLKKTYSKQKYSGNPFNKDSSSLVIIDYVENSKIKRLFDTCKEWILNKKIVSFKVYATIVILSAIVLLCKTCCSSRKESISNNSNIQKEKTEININHTKN